MFTRFIRHVGIANGIVVCSKMNTAALDRPISLYDAGVKRF